MMERPLTANIRPDAAPPDLADYRRQGGYEGLREALNMAPADLIEMIAQSGLRGRGGAGFPTATKWRALPPAAANPGPRYLVVNADEMEPGTFKDRLLLEGDPHQMLEAMIVSGHAISATTGYIFLRGEYYLAAHRLEQAIAEARAAGLLGTGILGSDFDFDVHLHTGAGRYICGEETALLNSLEGKRAIPRAKPPFPQTSGLWGRPTIVNNVETLCNVPHIVRYGVDWFKSIGRNGEGGTKLYGVSGRVKRPGTYELPMGATLRELIEDHAGGMQNGYRLRALLPGGASTAFLGADQLDVPMDFASIERAGSRLGTGTAIILDDRTCPVGMIGNLQHFFAQESCGWCVPCRDGLPWVERLLAGIEDGQGRESDLDMLALHTGWLAPGRTFCALAPGAMATLESGLKMFRAEFERHIHDKTCSWR